MSYQAGDTYPATVTVRDDEGNLINAETLALRVREPDGTATSYDLDDAIIVHDSLGEYHADVLLDSTGMWVIEWSTDDEEQVEGVQVWVSPTPAMAVTFATIDELALVMGKTGSSDLTAAQLAQGYMLLEMATGLIVEAVGKTDAWAAALDPIPRALRATCLSIASRLSHNPTGMTSQTESLGAYSYTQRYESGGSSPSGAAALALTDAERLLCRRAARAATSGTAMLDSVAAQYESNADTVAIDGYIG
jgi:hypothetical protein